MSSKDEKTCSTIVEVKDGFELTNNFFMAYHATNHTCMYAFHPYLYLSWSYFVLTFEKNSPGWHGSLLDTIGVPELHFLNFCIPDMILRCMGCRNFFVKSGFFKISDSPVMGG